jgi:hypothetical protein
MKHGDAADDQGDVVKCIAYESRRRRSRLTR